MAPITFTVLKEATVVGIGLIIIVIIVSQLVLWVKPDIKPTLPVECSSFNSYKLE